MPPDRRFTTMMSVTIPSVNISTKITTTTGKNIVFVVDRTVERSNEVSVTSVVNAGEGIWWRDQLLIQSRKTCVCSGLRPELKAVSRKPKVIYFCFLKRVICNQQGKGKLVELSEQHLGAEGCVPVDHAWHQIRPRPATHAKMAIESSFEGYSRRGNSLTI